MKAIILYFILAATMLYGCRKDDFPADITPARPIVPTFVRAKNDTLFHCTEMRIPDGVRISYPTTQSAWNGYSKTVSKGYVVDSAAWATKFNHSDSAATVYVRKLSQTVFFIQMKDSIKTTASLIKIMHNDYNIKGDINKFGDYCFDSLKGKADIFTLLSGSYYSSAGIGWIGFAPNSPYVDCVCGIGGVLKMNPNQIPKPLVVISDEQLVSHEEGHLMNAAHSFNCGAWYHGLFCIDVSGRLHGYGEGDCPPFSNDSLPIKKGSIMGYFQFYEGANLDVGYTEQVADTMRHYINNSLLINP